MGHGQICRLWIRHWYHAYLLIRRWKTTQHIRISIHDSPGSALEGIPRPPTDWVDAAPNTLFASFAIKSKILCLQTAYIGLRLDCAGGNLQPQQADKTFVKCK